MPLMPYSQKLPEFADNTDECVICAALVKASKMQFHREWHDSIENELPDLGF